MKEQSTSPVPEKPAAHRGPPAHVTFAGCCLIFFVSIIFLHNHNSMAYVHSTIVYSLEAPAGWLQSTSRTTVRAVTIKNAAGEAVTRAAVTATTTTTTVAARAGSAENSSTGKASVGPPRLRRSIISSMWGHLSQHSAVHAAQVVAATAKATLPEGRAQGEVELQPQRVAQVVQKAKAAEEKQQGTEQGAATEPTTAAEKYAGLYGAGGAGSVVFKPTSDLSSCPEGTAAPQGATVLILLADSSSGPAVLKRSLDGLMLLYSQASADIRAAFHLYIGLDGDNAEMEQLAHQYAVDSLGAVKLVHHRSSSTVSHTSSGTDTAGSSGSVTSSSTQQEKTGGDKQAGTAPSSTARADHVRLMLHVFLQCFQYPSVLLLEDDWKLLPDFFEYFDATQWLLGSDSSVYCISAWNPLLGQQQHLQHHSSRMAHVHRVDTNPGQGWLLGKATGLQLLKTWPQDQTLDWQQHIHSMGLQYGQQCVVPDVSRMVPAAVHDTAEAAHIVAATDAAGDAAGMPAEGEALLPALEFDHSSSSSSSSSTASSDAGAVDQGAASAPEVAWATAAEAAAKAAVVADGVNTAEKGQQGAVHGQPVRSAWLGRDMSYLMAAGYKKWLHQRLLAAKAVDVATAVMLSDKKRAARVTYSTAAELSAAAGALGVPLTLTQGIRYCYSLPTTPATQHCQDFLPDMAYEGTVIARTQLGVRVYFMHLSYINALQESKRHAGSVTAQGPDTGAAGTATAR